MPEPDSQCPLCGDFVDAVPGSEGACLCGAKYRWRHDSDDQKMWIVWMDKDFPVEPNTNDSMKWPPVCSHCGRRVGLMLIGWKAHQWWICAGCLAERYMALIERYCSAECPVCGGDHRCDGEPNE